LRLFSAEATLFFRTGSRLKLKRSRAFAGKSAGGDMPVFPHRFVTGAKPALLR
jgi:hypothetical protein